MVKCRTRSRPRSFVFFRGVGAGYIEAMGMRLLRGRSLERQDVDRREPVIVINKALADMYFPGKDPIDQRVKSSTLPSIDAGSAVADDRGRRRQHIDHGARGTDTVAADVHADVDRRRT